MGGRNWLGPAFFAKFTKLEKLVLVKEPYEDNPARGDNWAARACIEKVAEMRKLRSLHVGGEAIWALPVRPFAYLRELVIQEPENMGAIGLVLRHCSPQLQSLSLVLDNLWVEKYLNAAFDSDPKALPNLRSFKLVMHGDSFNRYPSDVSDFLTNKKHLRRLDVDLNMDSADAGVYPQFFELLPELPELEVLGVSLSGYEFTSEKLKRLDGKLPLGLTALLIHFEFEINDVSAREWMDVVGFFLLSDSITLLKPSHSSGNASFCGTCTSWTTIGHSTSSSSCSRTILRRSSWEGTALICAGSSVTPRPVCLRTRRGGRTRRSGSAKSKTSGARTGSGC